MNREMIIAVDSREQKPMHDLDGVEVSKGVTVRYETASLSVYDYALMADLTPTDGKLMVPGWACERKSLGDLVGSLFNADNYRRELAKLERAKAAWGHTGRPYVYVVEGDYEAISKYDYSRFPSGKITPKVVISKINEMRFKHNIHVLLCRSRIQAEYMVISLLKKRFTKVLFNQKTKGSQ
jgi:ERCC4-type nuclease